MYVIIPKTSSCCRLTFGIGDTSGEGMSGALWNESSCVSSGSGREAREVDADDAEAECRDGLIVDALGVDWYPILLISA